MRYPNMQYFGFIFNHLKYTTQFNKEINIVKIILTLRDIASIKNLKIKELSE